MFIDIKNSGYVIRLKTWRLKLVFTNKRIPHSPSWACCLNQQWEPRSLTRKSVLPTGSGFFLRNASCISLYLTFLTNIFWARILSISLKHCRKHNDQYLFHCSFSSTLARLTFGEAHSPLWGGCPVHYRIRDNILSSTH